MTWLSKRWLRTFAFRWLVACFLHSLLLAELSGRGTVAALFSPGSHLSYTTLAVCCAFLVLRVYVMLLWPAALVSLAAWLMGPRTT